MPAAPRARAGTGRGEPPPEFDPQGGAACLARLIEALPGKFEQERVIEVERALDEHGLCPRTAAIIQDKHGFLELFDGEED